MQSLFRGIKLRKKVKSGFKSISNNNENQENIIKYHNIKSKKIVRNKWNKIKQNKIKYKNL